MNWLAAMVRRALEKSRDEEEIRRCRSIMVLTPAQPVIDGSCVTAKAHEETET